MLFPALALTVADPVPPTPDREKTVAAAMQVVRNLYAAVSRHDYRAAFAIWHGTQSYAHFRRGYAATRDVRVTFLEPGEPEGGAGSIYVELPVRVDAVSRAGVSQHFVGSYTLRRVNDVDGSTAAQRRWHIASAQLKPVRAAH